MIQGPIFLNDSLTEIEVFGLKSRFNLADGHSYIDADKYFSDVLKDLPNIWRLASQTSIPEMENIFKQKFAKIFDLPGLQRQRDFSICPTASNSIDIVGAWARSMNLKVGLLEPTFDNLAQLLRRRDVDLEPIPEDNFEDLAALEAQISSQKLGAVFIINPNNPTGRIFSSESLTRIIDICKRLNLVLILDTSFRFCHRTNIDEYTLLQDSKVSYLILEDTGKLWPTLDTKASLLSYSPDIAPLIRKIYEEIYLSTSNLSLAIIGAFIDFTMANGGLPYLHAVLKERRNAVELALANLPVYIENQCAQSLMSVIWLNIKDTGLCDLELVKYLAQYQISVLPGRYFFWNNHHHSGHQYIRIALLKPEEQFKKSVLTLKNALMNLKRTTTIVGGLQTEFRV